MGKAMASRLIDAGHDLIVWNRSSDKCLELVAKGAKQGESPDAVAKECPITIGMVSDPPAAKQVGEAVAQGITGGHAYVDMSTVDSDTAIDIANLITSKGGRFVEAPVSGSKGPAEQGTLVILAAGDQAVLDEVAPIFEVLGKKTINLGAEVGAGARMKLCVNAIMGSFMTALGEGYALAHRLNLKEDDLTETLVNGAMACPLVSLKCPSLKQPYTIPPPAFPLKHAQKDMRLAVLEGDRVCVSTPVFAASNESFKRAREAGLGDSDIAAVYAPMLGPKN